MLCRSGQGELHVDGRVLAFGPDTTVVLPRGRPHQIFSVGADPLEILGVFGATPVGTFAPEGGEIALPWRT